MQMLIDGKWTDKGKKIEVRHPYDNTLIDTVPNAEEKDMLG